MGQVTTHILDTSKGQPAAGIAVFLYQQHPEEWREVAIGTSNKDGRVPDLMNREVVRVPGIYKLRFETKAYFDEMGIQTFYPFIEITFTIIGQEHYHVPLLLTPYGYSTYRGS